ncbi:MAG: hypothetical protein Q8O87_04470 [bacterium]|nr:hypothetical protein [bacterium]
MAAKPNMTTAKADVAATNQPAREKLITKPNATTNNDPDKITLSLTVLDFSHK